jgi:hypothetical protein
VWILFNINKFNIKYKGVEDELKENFIIKNNNQDQILYKNGIGQFDTENNMIKEFICKYDCIKSFHISDKTLQKSLDNQMLYNGTYFKYLGSKLML